MSKEFIKHCFVFLVESSILSTPQLPCKATALHLLASSLHVIDLNTCDSLFAHAFVLYPANARDTLVPHHHTSTS